MLNGLDLFTGIGGLTLALSEWVRPVAYCEIDRYARGVLLSRMSTGELPVAPIWDDIRHLKPKGDIDIIYGGFPCQDLSSAGPRTGLEGKRSGLFFEAVRLVRECKPQFVFLENVAGVRKYVPTIRGEFEALGYAVRDGFIPAPPISGFEGLRWFMLAAAESFLGQEWVGLHEKHADDGTPRKSSWPILKAHYENLLPAWEPAFSESGRDADGVSARMDRIKGLGNAVVPIQAREAFKILMGLAHKHYEEQSRGTKGENRRARQDVGL